MSLAELNAQRRRSIQAGIIPEAADESSSDEEPSNLPLKQPNLAHRQAQLRAKLSVRRKFRHSVTRNPALRVIIAHRPKSSAQDEISLHVGQMVKVSRTVGDRMFGTCGTKTGWFPARCVATKETKARPSSAPRLSTTDDVDQSSPTASLIDLPGSEIVPRAASPLPTPAEASRPSLVPASPASSIDSSSKSLSDKTARLKMRKTSSDEWRREILGDMTVMNQDELLELGAVLRAGVRKNRVGVVETPSSSPSVRLNSVVDSTAGSPHNTLLPTISEDQSLKPVTESTARRSSKGSSPSRKKEVKFLEPVIERKEETSVKNSEEIPYWAIKFMNKVQSSSESDTTSKPTDSVAVTQIANRSETEETSEPANTSRVDRSKTLQSKLKRKLRDKK